MSGPDAIVRQGNSRLPRLVVPRLFESPFVDGSSSPATNTVRFMQVRIPRTGLLRHLSMPVVTAAGNVKVGVYSIDPSTLDRTLVAGSGSVAFAGANVWQDIYDPQIAVQAGEIYDMAFVTDGAATLGRRNQVNAAFAVLPSAFSSGVTDARLVSSYAAGSLTLPSPVASASLASGGAAVYPIVGYIS